MGPVGLDEYAQVVHRLSAALKEIDRLKDDVETAERFVADMITTNQDLRKFGLNAPKCRSPHPEHEDVSCFRPAGHGEHHLNGTSRWQ